MSASQIAIEEGTTVTMHFSLTLENGELVDTNFDKQAPTFTFGDGSLMPGFEEALIGLKAGDKGEFSIPPEKGFGQHNPSNVQVIERRVFDASTELAEGAVFSFANAAGGEMPGVVKTFDDEEVTIDFNHPLAGRTIIFTVEIIDVRPEVTH